MAKIIDKGQITLQGGAVMSWKITDDEALTIYDALWDGSVTVGKDIKSEAKFRHLVLDESVQAIGVFNFSDWDCLEEVTLPPSIKCIEHAAFCGCKNLKRVNLSDGLEIIGADSFSGCESLETINFPSTLKEIYEYAFDGCDSLHDVLLPGRVSLEINGLHYKKSVIVSDNPYELTLLCDTLWEGEVFEIPATVEFQGREYTVTGIDVGQSQKSENLRELRIPSTVRHIFPEACVGITSLRKVNIPDYCYVHSGAFAECGIEELILGEHVILEEECFQGIRAKQVNIPDTTQWAPFRREAYECDSYFEIYPVSAEDMDDFIEYIFRYSIWHYMEILKSVRKGDWGAVEALAMSPLIPADPDEFDHKYPFSLDEIMSLMDENEKHLISQFEDNYSRALNTPVSDDDFLPF